MTAPTENRRPSEEVIAFVLVCCSVAIVGLLVLTTRSKEGDFFDSPGYWATWLLFPGIALVASLFRPTARTALVSAASLVGPPMVVLAFLGTVGHDPNDGASLWIVGEILLAIEGLFAFVGGLVGVLIGKVSARQAESGLQVRPAA
jgi:hypothetical protein